MSTSPEALPWSSLQLEEPEIPWDVMRTARKAGLTWPLRARGRGPSQP